MMACICDKCGKPTKTSKHFALRRLRINNVFMDAMGRTLKEEEWKQWDLCEACWDTVRHFLRG